LVSNSPSQKGTGKEPRQLLRSNDGKIRYLTIIQRGKGTNKRGMGKKSKGDRPHIRAKNHARGLDSKDTAIPQLREKRVAIGQQKKK